MHTQRPSAALRTTSCLALAAILAATAASAEVAADAEGTTVSLAYDHPLPNLPGKSVRGVLVRYEPGGASAPHTHPASAFIAATVLEGAVVSRVNDGPETVYRVGQSFFENPGDHHRVSRNASRTEPARLLAVFVLDTAETNLVTPDPAR